jgi:hypothetical protein
MVVGQEQVDEAAAASCTNGAVFDPKHHAIASEENGPQFWYRDFLTRLDISIEASKEPSDD